MENAVEQGCFLALVGDFNPAIFTPHWMASQSILSPDEADRADVEVIHKELARFRAANLRFDVLSSRCLVLAEAEPFVRALDTVALLFLKSLPHTPIRGIGLNYYVHVELGDQAKRMRFGREIAPVAIWEEAGLDVTGADGTKTGGASDVTMQTLRDDGQKGFIQATVQPSYRIPNNSGLFVQVTDQYGGISDPPLEPEKEYDVQPGRRRRGRHAISAPAEVAADPVNYVELLTGNFDRAFGRLLGIAEGIVARAERS